jgi:lactate racemase
MERYDESSGELRLPWGREEIRITLPRTWSVAGVFEPAASAAVKEVTAETHRSILEPIGSRTIRELAFPSAKVAIVIDDASRPTPVSLMLPAVVAELEQAGIARSAMTIVTALGVHRPMSEDELRSRIGAGLSDIARENHDCDNHERLTYLGVTRLGTRVLLNTTVAKADLIISVGCIEPHLIASFGGGYKNLIPGVAARETISFNHGLNCAPETFNMVGQPIERNPMRLDLEEAGRMIAAPVFIVNAVLDGTLGVVRIVSGDAVEAHREGVGVSRAVYGVPLERPADVVICDSHPMDQDLRQGAKALANTIRAVRRGGVQVVLMRAEEGIGVFGLAERKLPVGRRGLRVLAPLLAAILPRLHITGLADDERLFLYSALQAMRHCRLIVCIPTMTAEKRASFPFAELFATPQEALDRARGLIGAHAAVAVFPSGGSTYPIPALSRSGGE